MVHTTAFPGILKRIQGLAKTGTLDSNFIPQILMLYICSFLGGLSYASSQQERMQIASPMAARAAGLIPGCISFQSMHAPSLANTTSDPKLAF